MRQLSPAEQAYQYENSIGRRPGTHDISFADVRSESAPCANRADHGYPTRYIERRVFKRAKDDNRTDVRRCDEENSATKAARCSVGGLPLTQSWIRWRELGPELFHGLHQRAPIALGLVLVVVVHDHMYVEAGPAELLDLMP